MIRSTEQLVNEHKTIKVVLKIMKRVCDKLESGDNVDPEHLERIVEFIRIFADRCHHGKEEDLLFQAMEETGIPNKGRPDEENVFYALLLEHYIGRDYVKDLGDAIAKYKAGDRSSTYKIIENARDYVELLTQHIEKEDDIAYLIADKTLPEEKKKELLEGFERVEIERIGVGRHEEFHKLVDRLEKTYLEPSAQ